MLVIRFQTPDSFITPSPLPDLHVVSHPLRFPPSKPSPTALLLHSHRHHLVQVITVTPESVIVLCTEATSVAPHSLITPLSSSVTPANERTIMFYVPRQMQTPFQI